METIYKLLLPLFCLFFYTGAIPQSIETRTTSDFSFKDVHGFPNADSMYLVADTLPYSNQVKSILRSVNRSADRGDQPEKDQVWNKLLELEPYRMDPGMDGEIKNLAKKFFSNIENSPHRYDSISVSEMQSFTQTYQYGHFEGFISAGRELLLRYPLNSDIRNNIALALMHHNNDLCAWVELETVRLLDPYHQPALINLTTLYERLGKREDAEKLSMDLLEMQKESEYKNPQVLYNAAWYRFMQGDYLQTDALLSEIEKEDVAKYENIQKLKELNKSELKKLSKDFPFLRVGALGRLGLSPQEDYFKWYLITGIIILAILVFLLLNPIYKDKDTAGAFFSHMFFTGLILALVYVLAWGYPTSETWGYFVGYAALPVGLLVAFLILVALFSGNN